MRDTATTAKVPDPYWSLWGKLKKQHERDERDDRRINEAGEVSGWHEECVMEEIQSESWRRTPLRLPHRPYKVEYNGVYLIVRGIRKRITDDPHAVNTLRKLDTDDAYLAQFLAAGEEAKK